MSLNAAYKSPWLNEELEILQDAVRKFAQRAVKGVEIALFENSAAANLLPA